jgi:hypothetical protein
MHNLLEMKWKKESKHGLGGVKPLSPATGTRVLPLHYTTICDYYEALIYKYKRKKNMVQRIRTLTSQL